jgi:membrane protein YqaA with SNARE-associated domain
MKRAAKTQKKSKLKLLHQYYTYTGFYSFVGKSLKKAILPLSILIAVIFLVNAYVYNINNGLQKITEVFATGYILVIFFLSESFLGLIPPEIFIAWTKKTTNPIVFLTILASLSYIGGIISFFIGTAALRINSIKNYLENKMAKHLKNTKKWGGFLIVSGALLPIPFSITCMAAGMIKYPLKGVLSFGLFRFLRFALYAFAIFQFVD